MNTTQTGWTTSQIELLVTGYQLALATERARPRLQPADAAAYIQSMTSHAGEAAHPAHDAHRTIFDVSALVKSPRITGIQRVTMALGHELAKLAPALGLDLHFSNFDRDGFYEVDFDAANLTPPARGFHATGRKLAFKPGDRMVLSDFTPMLMERQLPFLRAARRDGVNISFVIHDLLPALNPQWSEAVYVTHFVSWWFGILQFADRLIAVSHKVAEDIRALLAVSHPEPAGSGRPVSLAFFGLGCDGLRDEAGAPAKGAASERAPHSPSFLAIGGGWEPRKNLHELIEAVATLRREGIDAALTITGAPWRRELPQNLTMQPLWKDRLTFTGHVEDVELARLLRTCDAFVSASLDEGYGLPAVEAAHAGVPVILRDLPVYREVTGGEALYFGAGGAVALADALRRFLSASAAERQAYIPKKSLRSWSDAARLLAAIVRHDLSFARLGAASQIRLNFGQEPLNL